MCFRKSVPDQPELRSQKYNHDGISLVVEADRIESIKNLSPTPRTANAPQDIVLPPRPSSPTKKSTRKVLTPNEEEDIALGDLRNLNEKRIGIVTKSKSLGLIDTANIAGMDAGAIIKMIDSPMKMGLSIMHSLSGSMLAFGQGTLFLDVVVWGALVETFNKVLPFDFH